MQIERTGETYYREFPLDWMIGATLIFLGSLLFYFVYDPVLWGTWVSTEGPRVPIGFLERIEGGVRFKRSGTSIWFDLPQTTPASDGDSIYTSEKGRAQIFFESGEKITLGPDSLVVLKVERPRTPEASWDGVRPQGVIEIKKGKVEVETASGSRGVLLETEKGRVALKSDSKYSERLTLERGKSGALSLSAERPDQFKIPVKVAARDEEKMSRGRAPASAFPIRPEILAPPNRERFTTEPGGSVSVGLRWQRIPAGFDVEVEVYAEGATSAAYQGVGGPVGTSVALAKGEYYWVARSRDSEGRASIWTPRYFFSVDEQVAQVSEKREPASEPVAEAPKPKLKKVESYRAARPPEDLDLRPTPAEPLVKAQVKPAAQTSLPKPELPRVKKIETPKLAREPAAVPPLPAIELEPAQISRSGNDMLRIGLRWKPISGAEQTEVMVFDGGMLFQRSTTRQSFLNLEVQAMSTAGLFYQVAATFEDGRVATSELLPIEVSAFLPVPNLPDDGAIFQPGSEVLMTWSKSQGAEGYEIEIATDAAFRNRVHGRPTIENFEAYSVSRIGTYYWRIRAINEKGDSGWSLSKRFEVREDGTELR